MGKMAPSSAGGGVTWRFCEEGIENMLGTAWGHGHNPGRGQGRLLANRGGQQHHRKKGGGEEKKAEE